MRPIRALSLLALCSFARAQAPLVYCTSGTSTNGCVPTIAANAQPDVANSAGCVITTSSVDGQRTGLSFYGIDNTGFAPLPWGVGSTSSLCVKPPTRRIGPPQSSQGTPGQCDGSYVVHWDAFQLANPTSLGNPWVPGQRVFVQSWNRDPLAVKGATLSNALELVMQAPPVQCSTTIPGMINIPAGSFDMGSAALPGTPYHNTFGCQPVHTVVLTYCFWIGATEVTQSQYAALMGTNPSFFSGPTNPVERVRWQDARAYCAALTAQQSALGNVPNGYEYRLPTEAEWEYTCRASTSTEFNVGPALMCSDAKFAFSLHSLSSCTSSGTAPVAGFAPNAWGLFDTHGSIWEWCLDSYAAYPSGTAVDPFVTGGSDRLLRGGSWNSISNNCRAADRRFSPPDIVAADIGFRVVLAPIRVP